MDGTPFFKPKLGPQLPKVPNFCGFIPCQRLRLAEQEACWATLDQIHSIPPTTAAAKEKVALPPKPSWSLTSKLGALAGPPPSMAAGAPPPIKAAGPPPAPSKAAGPAAPSKAAGPLPAPSKAAGPPPAPSRLAGLPLRSSQKTTAVSSCSWVEGGPYKRLRDDVAVDHCYIVWAPPANNAAVAAPQANDVAVGASSRANDAAVAASKANDVAASSRANDAAAAASTANDVAVAASSANDAAVAASSANAVAVAASSANDATMAAPPPCYRYVPWFHPDAAGSPDQYNDPTSYLHWGRKGQAYFWNAPCNATPDIRTIVEFLRRRSNARGWPLTTYYGQPVLDDRGWWRFPYLPSRPHPEWHLAHHGSKMEATYAITTEGMLEPGDNTMRMMKGRRAVYLMQNAEDVEFYSRWVHLCRDGVWWRVRWEVLADRSQSISPPRKTNQWLQPKHAVELVALCVCGENMCGMNARRLGDEVAKAWVPKNELRPRWLSAVAYDVD